jgi:hypothetical protein
MVRLMVCPCFRLSEREEFMEPVENRPWDAWHVIDDGKRFIINYVSDGFYHYLKHLLHSPGTDKFYLSLFGSLENRP